MVKILVIEASRTEALRTRLILEREGFQVSWVAEGSAGLAQAAAEAPNVILLDTLMPKMSGYEVCGRLRIDPATALIPIILLGTVEEQAGLSETAKQFFLIKPFEPSALVAGIKALTNGVKPSGDPVAEILRYQAQVRQLEQTAALAKKTRSDLLANMSHELRTPLHEIMGMTELLLGTELTAEQQGFITTAKNASGALLSLISDVIEFSEIEAGQLELVAKPFELAEPIERMTELMASRASEKGLGFAVNVSALLPRTYIGDANRVRQVLATLVDNALKFTERGSILVQADGTPHDGVVDLHFQIADTGVGIPLDRREIIFEPFQQADNSATRQFGGMGLGLALAKQLVTKMGGRIWVESETSKGSTFHVTLTLPSLARAASGVPVAVAAGALWPRPLNILVAEDSPTNQLIAKASLKKAGHTVTIAVNGLEAVRAYEAARADAGAPQFDLVLMDVSMPVMDGLEATRMIRVKEQTLAGHVLIVAMTAFATKEYHEKCLEAGMDAYVTKPVRIDDLNKTLEPLLTQAPLAMPQAEPRPVVLREALDVVGDDVDILRQAVAASLAEVPEELAALKAGLAQANAKQVEAKAHRLKGVMGNLGGLVARDAGQVVETLGEKGNLTGGAEAVERFEKEIGRVVAFYSDPKWEQLAREAGGA